jgi:hypothetical protein
MRDINIPLQLNGDKYLTSNYSIHSNISFSMFYWQKTCHPAWVHTTGFEDKKRHE